MLRDPEWRKVAREEWDRVDKSLFPNTRPEYARFTSVTKPENERWLAKSLKDLVDERGGHPSDVFADWILENDLEPGVVAAGVLERRRGEGHRDAAGAGQVKRRRRRYHRARDEGESHPGFANRERRRRRRRKSRGVRRFERGWRTRRAPGARHPDDDARPPAPTNP